MTRHSPESRPATVLLSSLRSSKGHDKFSRTDCRNSQSPVETYSQNTRFHHAQDILDVSRIKPARLKQSGARAQTLRASRFAYLYPVSDSPPSLKTVCFIPANCGPLNLAALQAGFEILPRRLQSPFSLPLSLSVCTALLLSVRSLHSFCPQSFFCTAVYLSTKSFILPDIYIFLSLQQQYTHKPQPTEPTMRFSPATLAFVAYTTFVQAATECPHKPSSENPTAGILAVYSPLHAEVPAGQPYDITWDVRNFPMPQLPAHC